MLFFILPLEFDRNARIDFKGAHPCFDFAKFGVDQDTILNIRLNRQGTATIHAGQWAGFEFWRARDEIGKGDQTLVGYDLKVFQLVKGSIFGRISPDNLNSLG